jgi:hypothetical protein
MYRQENDEYALRNTVDMTGDKPIASLSQVRVLLIL